MYISAYELKQFSLFRQTTHPFMIELAVFLLFGWVTCLNFLWLIMLSKFSRTYSSKQSEVVHFAIQPFFRLDFEVLIFPTEFQMEPLFDLMFATWGEQGFRLKFSRKKQYFQTYPKHCHFGSILNATLLSHDLFWPVQINVKENVQSNLRLITVRIMTESHVLWIRL